MKNAIIIFWEDESTNQNQPNADKKSSRGWLYKTKSAVVAMNSEKSQGDAGSELRRNFSVNWWTIYRYPSTQLLYTSLYTLYIIQVYNKHLWESYPWWFRYVLKPQREGGGNNVYGDDIRPFLKVNTEKWISLFHKASNYQPPGDWKQWGKKCLHPHGQDTGKY